MSDLRAHTHNEGTKSQLENYSRAPPGVSGERSSGGGLSLVVRIGTTMDLAHSIHLFPW